MRYPRPHGDLPILSVELYEDSTSRGSSGRPAAKRKASPSAVSARSSDGGSRKRARTEAADAADADEEKRKARGRPRLDTKDETAADRRRTQIRLAQRAYRNRKENAIQTLERKVQHLKDTNEEMSNAFMQLHDFALSKGLLDKMPDLGRQLRETTEKFLALARDASEDEEKDDESKAASVCSPTDTRHDNERARSNSSGPVQAAETAEAAPLPEPATATEENPKMLYGGLMVSYDPTSQADFAASIPTTTTLPPQASPAPPAFTHPPYLHTLHTHLTRDSPPIPILTLPPPTTYANHETTFGRRLQRYALEQALLLITMPDPPHHFLSRVFGFCLLLESPQTIHRRVRRMLGRDTHQTLHNWQFPFFHLGGAGTHFEALPELRSGEVVGLGNQGTLVRMGNQGTVDVGKPEQTAGFATGPFEAGVNVVRDGGGLGPDMRMVLPGFAGEYFDCDEAEVYLYRRGVVMTPGEDVVTVEVDMDDVEVGGDDGYGGWGGGRVWKARTVDPFSRSSAGSGLSPGLSPGSGLSPVSNSSGNTLVEMPSLSSQVQDMASGGWSMGNGGMADPALGDVFAQGDPFMATTAAGEASAPLCPSAPGGGGMFPFGDWAADGGETFGYGLNTSQNPRRETVDIDVMLLLKELTQRCICLGRSPGMKQADIDAAFWAAVKGGME